MKVEHTCDVRSYTFCQCKKPVAKGLKRYSSSLGKIRENTVGKQTCMEEQL